MGDYSRFAEFPRKGGPPLLRPATVDMMAAKPNTSKDAAWLQLTRQLSDEAMEGLLSIDPSMIVEELATEHAT